MGSAKIMIVEDNTMVAQEYRDCLENLGYTVVSIVDSAEEFIEKAVTERPDAVLMDIQLRHKMDDGIDAAEQIHRRLQIPVVFLSAYSDRKMIEQAKRVSSFDYIVKPFEERELNATLEMALYKAHAEKELRQLKRELQQVRDNLEWTVKARTAELVIKNRQLKMEIAERRRSEQALRESEQNYRGAVDHQTGKSLRKSEQRSRHLSSRLLAAQETERRRISMEIIDELGPSLALLKIQLKAIADKLRKDQPKLKREVSNANDVIAQLMEDTRRLSRDLSPSIIQDLKISGTLKWMLHDFEKHTGIDVSLDMVNIDARFAVDAQLILYRIFQEALNNVRKHAQASHVGVVIQKKDDCVVIRIEDDGKGFDLEETLNRHVTERGMGLLVLEERARMLRGTLKLFSRKNKGTWINLTIPVTIDSDVSHSWQTLEAVSKPPHEPNPKR